MLSCFLFLLWENKSWSHITVAFGIQTVFILKSCLACLISHHAANSSCQTRWNVLSLNHNFVLFREVGIINVSLFLIISCQLHICSMYLAYWGWRYTALQHTRVASSSSVQPLGRWHLRRLSYQGDDTARPQSVLRFIRSLISDAVRLRKNRPRSLCCLFAHRYLCSTLFVIPDTFFFSTPPTSLGPLTEGWWGSDPAALPGLASLLIGAHLVSPAAISAAVMLPSHSHFLGTLQRFFALEVWSASIFFSEG